MDIEKLKRVHFIGIGGIGMSALARLLKSKGVEITGSDSNESEVTDALIKEGINVSIGHDADVFSNNIDLIVYTLAIRDVNPEFLKAKSLGLPAYTYAEMLGKVSAEMQTIVISGTHGKTTTTAMTNSALRGIGLDPGMVVGSLLIKPKTNFIPGNSNIFVTEACEYKRSFLNLDPEVLVITNIEEDHLDYYRDLDDIKSAFMELANKVSEDGTIFCDFEDENLKEIIKEHDNKVLNYRKFLKDVPLLKVVGGYNRLNAAAALAVASLFDKELEGAKNGLANFCGTWRRMQFKGKSDNGAFIYDDYAHHPTEIKSVLESVKEEFEDKNIVVFFQPHLYSRTKSFLNDFVTALSLADEVFLLPIYAAREEYSSEISSQKLAERIKGAVFLKGFGEAKLEISERTESDLVITMGAGDVYKVIS